MLLHTFAYLCLVVVRVLAAGSKVFSGVDVDSYLCDVFAKTIYSSSWYAISYLSVTAVATGARLCCLPHPLTLPTPPAPITTTITKHVVCVVVCAVSTVLIYVMLTIINMIINMISYACTSIAIYATTLCRLTTTPRVMGPGIHPPFPLKPKYKEPGKKTH